MVIFFHFHSHLERKQWIWLLNDRAAWEFACMNTSLFQYNILKCSKSFYVCLFVCISLRKMFMCLPHFVTEHSELCANTWVHWICCEFFPIQILWYANESHLFYVYSINCVYVTHTMCKWVFFLLFICLCMFIFVVVVLLCARQILWMNQSFPFSRSYRKSETTRRINKCNAFLCFWLYSPNIIKPRN